MPSKKIARSEKWSRNKDNKRRAGYGFEAVKTDIDFGEMEDHESMTNVIANMGPWLASQGHSRDDVEQAIQLGLQHIMHEWEGKD